jgi:hypothetical protein
MRRCTLTLVLVLASAVLFVPSAGARRTATTSEARAMWRVVDPHKRCVHRRGYVSTVHSDRYLYGIVTIADGVCGNGSNVMRRKKTGGRWQTRIVGSDIGSPPTCASNVRRVPLRVLRDLFARPSLCADAR